MLILLLVLRPLIRGALALIAILAIAGLGVWLFVAGNPSSRTIAPPGTETLDVVWTNVQTLGVFSSRSASCEPRLADGDQTIEVTLRQGYSGFVCAIQSTIHQQGSLPARITGLKVSNPDGGLISVKTCIRMEGDPTSLIDALVGPDRRCVTTVTMRDGVDPNKVYTFDLTLNFASPIAVSGGVLRLGPAPTPTPATALPGPIAEVPLLTVGPESPFTPLFYATPRPTGPRTIPPPPPLGGSATSTPRPTATPTPAPTPTPRPATTAVIFSANSSVVGQPVTLSATVRAVPPAAGTPTGTVSFKDGAALVGTGTLRAGTATLMLTTLAVGQHALAAVYGGDARFTGSTSAVLPQTVNKGVTVIVLSSPDNPSVRGQPVTFTASVRPVAPAVGVAGGTVTFQDGAAVIGAGMLSEGVARLTRAGLAVANHPLTAIYRGDGSFAASTSPFLIQVVNRGATTVLVTSSVNPSLVGKSITLTATVRPVPPAAGTPAGTVTFKDGPRTYTASLQSGAATVTTAPLSVGKHTITAAYAGDASFTSSTSPPLIQLVNQGATPTPAATATPRTGTPTPRTSLRS